MRRRKSLRRRMLVRSSATGLPSLPANSTVRITLPGVGWVTEHNDARQGVIGSTLQRHFIAIPSSQFGNRYFWFSMDDGNGNQTGFDPGVYESSLAGYTGVEIELANTARDPEDVAEAFLAAAETIYGTENVLQDSDVVEITGDFTTVDIFSGSSWEGRGAAGYWGAQRYVRNGLGHVDGFGLAGNINGSFSANIFAPPVDNNRLNAIQFLIGATAGSDIRLLIYDAGIGGADENPEGAQLLYDSGVISAATLITNTWNTHYINANIEIGNGTSLWFSLVCEASSNTALNFQSVASGEIGQWNNQDALVGGLSNDVNVDPPAVFPAGATESGANITPAVRFVYAAAPYAANGQWQRNQWPTPFTPAEAWTDTSNGFPNQLESGGTLPPDVGGLYAVRLGCPMTPTVLGDTIRLWLRQGGVLRDPRGASLVFNSEVRLNVDSLGRAIYRADLPSEIFIQRSDPIWIGLEGDGNTNIHFQLVSSGGHLNIAPRHGEIAYSNPMDHPDNIPGVSEIEFESVDSADIEVNPANSTEVVYPNVEVGPGFNPPGPGDTFSAFRPQNLTPQFVDFQTNPFIIS